MIAGCRGNVIPNQPNQSNHPTLINTSDYPSSSPIDDKTRRKQYEDRKQELLSKKTLIVDFDKNFGKLRNTINVALFKARSKGTVFSEKEIASFYLDSLRLLNGFATINIDKFPQQNDSPINIYVVESLEKGMKPNIREIDSNGYAIVDSKAISHNRKLHKQKSQKNICGKQVSKDSEDLKTHDIFVMGPVTKGIKNEKGQKLSIGYLQRANNTDIKYFQQERDFSNQQFSETKVEVFPKVLVDAVTTKKVTNNGAKNGIRIISISYFFSFKELSQIKSTFKLKTEASAFIDIDDKYIKRLLNTQDKYVLLISLFNLPDEDDEKKNYTKEELCEIENSIKMLPELKEEFKNLILVSTSRFDTFPKEKNEKIKKRIFDLNDPNNYTHKRPMLAKEGIEFFTVLGDYNISPTKAYPTKIQLKSTKKPTTSFATSALSAIVFNILSLNPKLSSFQVKKILKRGALNYDGNTSVKEVGYVVNPTKSYILTIGSLIANAQRDYYECTGDIVLTKDEDLTKDENWIINCNNSQQGRIISQQGGLKFNHSNNNSNMLAFYHGAHVHKSSLGSESSSIVQVTKRNSDATFHKPEYIVIKLSEIKFYENEIVVEFEKEFCSPKYSDKTRKIMVIDYTNRSSDDNGRIPRLTKELVLETSSFKCQL